MRRGHAVAMAFVVVGALGTAIMGQWDAFSIGFFFLFWGGLAAAITWTARGRWNADKHDALPVFNPDAEQPIDHPKINPATGLPMAGNFSYGVDVGGNTCGTTDASDAMASVHHPNSSAQVGL